eukprot:1139102-Pelagomonas_calceolata.AAC.1
MSPIGYCISAHGRCIWFLVAGGAVAYQQLWREGDFQAEALPTLKKRMPWAEALCALYPGPLKEQRLMRVDRVTGSIQGQCCVGAQPSVSRRSRPAAAVPDAHNVLPGADPRAVCDPRELLHGLCDPLELIHGPCNPWTVIPSDKRVKGPSSDASVLFCLDHVVEVQMLRSKPAEEPGDICKGCFAHHPCAALFVNLESMLSIQTSYSGGSQLLIIAHQRRMDVWSHSQFAPRPGTYSGVSSTNSAVGVHHLKPQAPLPMPRCKTIGSTYRGAHAHTSYPHTSTGGRTKNV